MVQMVADMVASPGDAEVAVGCMEAVRSRIVDGGRIIVPSSFRKAMGIGVGDTVVLELHGDELRVRPARAALRRLQAQLKPYAPKAGEPLVSEELIADRRRESSRG